MRKSRFISVWIMMWISCYVTYAQHQHIVDKWEEYMEELAETIEDESRLETIYADLSYISTHPFELNSVTREQLLRLPFLKDNQIEQLMEYRRKYGQILSIYELKNLDSFDFETINRLISFVYVGEYKVEKVPLTVKNMLKRSQNELVIKYDRCFQQKAGYQQSTDSLLIAHPNSRYLGESFYHSVRYSYQLDNRIQAGMIAEKDAGEPFWKKEHKGYDYYSAHIFLRELTPWLKSLTIGDYKASFGQGLVLSHDFTLSRSSMVTQVERRTQGFRRHYSTNEYDFFRGAAATLSFQQVDINLFYSYRKLDAAVDRNRVTSFKTDGLHRLTRDREKKNILPMQTYGTNIRYATPSVSLGMTLLSYSFNDYQVDPDQKPYNMYYFRGNRNINMSVDYLFKNRLIKFYGETSMSQNHAIATLNTLQLTPSSYFDMLLMGRYYDKKYQAFFANSFSELSDIRNEQGLYMAMQWKPYKYWRWSAYADVYRFPWLRYGVNAPTNGEEYMTQLDYTPTQQLSSYIRYKYIKRESLSAYTKHRLRWQLVYNPTVSFSMRSAVEGTVYKPESIQSKGWLVSQSFSWKPVSFPLRVDLSIAYFDTDNYQTRLYAYEKNLLYTYYIPSFYGEGIHLATSLGWNIYKGLTLSVKYGFTHYFDRDKIGSDLELIEGNEKMDLSALLCWKF